MSNKDYKTIRIANESYDKLRELKFKRNMSFVDILKESIDKTYEELMEKEKQIDKDKKDDE
ncbi:hypothetical protein [Staphylococcus equorum]|uniref:hypothetical protein n=1 Tax=Staphylococcus equorum TaxID=246432 RepID=UPI000853C349|nr:hypothetical protein [Staphylococcus equorum]OEK60571.1 hypothetical protein ASS99_10950 [Staphylococcus equorum]